MIQSVYVHIPFCRSICSYCAFSKMFYEKSLVDRYLDALEQEIKSTYQQEKLKTLYIGGGSPSCLSLRQLERLLQILSLLKKEKEYEYTIELNIEDMTLEKLKLLFQYGINRLSFGIETVQQEQLQKMNRHHDVKKVQSVLKQAKDVGFSNINVDLIYALPHQTLRDVKRDLKFICTLPITHVSTYSLMIEEHTKFYVDGVTPVSEEMDEAMYWLMREELKKVGFAQYEISNFCKPGYESKHNLTYWDNAYYYGFGLSASGYVPNKRYTNTKSINQYLSGNWIKEIEELTKFDEMSYEMILGLRKLEGVAKQKFYHKFQKDVKDVFDYQAYLDRGLLEEDQNYLKIPEAKLYVSNEAMLAFVGGNNNE